MFYYEGKSQCSPGKNGMPNQAVPNYNIRVFRVTLIWTKFRTMAATVTTTTVRVYSSPLVKASVARRRAFPSRLPSHTDDRPILSRSSTSPDSEEKVSDTKNKDEYVDKVPSKAVSLGTGVNLFDPAATASRFITRRFGFVGGLAFVGLLASVEGGEIVKALLERDFDGSGEEVTLPSGVVYTDVRIGGGKQPKKGDFVGVHLQITSAESDKLILDTKAKGRPVAFIFLKRPLLPPLCRGLEEVVSTMGRGGIRKMKVPAELGFGAEGAVLPDGTAIPPNTALNIVVTIEDVSPSYL